MFVSLETATKNSTSSFFYTVIKYVTLIDYSYNMTDRFQRKFL